MAPIVKTVVGVIEGVAIVGDRVAGWFVFGEDGRVQQVKVGRLIVYDRDRRAKRLARRRARRSSR